MRYILTLLLIVFSLFATAQSFNVDLSKDHIAKIENAKDPAAKLRKYKRFYQRDSVKRVKAWQRSLKHKPDSILAANQSGFRSSQEKLQGGLGRSLGRINNLDSKLLPGQADSVSTDSSAAHIALPTDVAVPGVAIPEMPVPAVPTGNVDALEGNLQGHAQSQLNGVGELNEAKAIKGQAGQEINQYKNEYGGYLQGDSVAAQHAKDKGKAMAQNEVNSQLKGAGLPDAKYAQYLSHPDSLGGLAKSKGKAFATDQLNSQFGSMKDLQEYRKEMAESSKLKEMYSREAGNPNDSAYMRRKAQEQAQKQATNYLNDHPEVMQPIQKRMNMLMNKYSIVPNSNDLSTATKASSLKGKTFRERLVVGANFQILTLVPFSIDAAPVIGYKFNRKFVAGIGGNYRHTFQDTKSATQKEIIGYKGFVSYDLLRTYFAYGEFARNSPGVYYTDGQAKRIWKNALILGAGRRLSIAKKIDMTLVVGYNFLYKRPDPVYPQAWVVRFGFQLSELAMMPKGR